MAPMIHLKGRSFVIDASTPLELQEIAGRIEEAALAGAPVAVPILIGGGKVTLYVRTALVDLIAVDPDGTGAGFLHGFHG